MAPGIQLATSCLSGAAAAGGRDLHPTDNRRSCCVRITALGILSWTILSWECPLGAAACGCALNAIWVGGSVPRPHGDVLWGLQHVGVLAQLQQACWVGTTPS